MISLLTIGHSTHGVDVFIRLLKQHAVALVVDVRSAPYSRHNPQYNREALSASLGEHGIKYLFLGEELGARSTDPSCYEDGKLRYSLLENTDLFKAGIERVRSEAHAGVRLALMCAEKDPLHCHRTILVAKNLVSEGIPVEHILSDGRLESHEEANSRLISELRMSEDDLFATRQDVVDRAYRKQEERIAYVAESHT